MIDCPSPGPPGPPLEWGPWLQAHPLVHLVYDVQTLQILAANTAAQQRYGYGPDELLTLTRADLLQPDEVSALRAFLAGLPGSARAGVQRVWSERTRDGRLLHADVRGQPVWFAGRPARLATVIDAGERTALQARFEHIASGPDDAHDRLAALLAAIPDLWLVLDADGRYLEVSDPLHPSLSAPWPHKRGRRFEDSLPASLALRALSLMRLAQSTGEPQGHHYDLVVMSGERRSFEARYVPLSGGRTMALIRDTTDTVRLEQRFRAMADAVPVGIFMTDGEGGCTYTNAAWQALYGLSMPTSLGTGWARAVHVDDRAHLFAALQRLQAQPAPLEIEYRIVQPGGAVRQVSARSSPIRQPDGSPIGHVGTVVDVTQVRELEAARQARAVAEEAGRRQTAFLSRLSHELRTPLNAILGFAELLQQDGAVPDPRPRSYLGHVVQAGRHMLALVDDLLELQRIEQDTLQPLLRPLALQPQLQACAEMLRPMAQQAGLRLELAAADAQTPPVVRCDERALRQILLNLGSNAIKYGGQGALVRLAAGPAADGGVELRISDTGPGMSEAQLARLFKPFERLGQEAGSVPGSGLGLVITQHLAQRVGARVRLESQAGKGTTAVLWLPAEPPQNPAVAAPDAPV